MKKLAVGIVLLGVLAAGGFAAWRLGWLQEAGVAVPFSGPGAAAGAGGQAGAPSAGRAPGNAQAGEGASGGANDALPAFDGNIAAHEWGGKIESVTGAKDESEWNLSSPLRGQGFSTGQYGPGPKDFVISFFGREAALIDRVEIVPAQPYVPRDVEVWTSTAGPASGFAKVAAATMAEQPSTTIRFDPVEARFVKVRMMTNSFGNDEAFDVAWIKVFEAQRAGYVPLLTRRRDVLDPLVGTPAAGVPVKALSGPACDPEAPAPLPPSRSETRRALIVTAGWGGQSGDEFAWMRLKSEDPKARAERSPDLDIFGRVELRVIATDLARPYHLSKEFGYDTVVLEQACDQGRPLPPSFTKALMPWVAAGHKLIIHDADKCAPSPDYAWLPYRFKSDNPGAQGADGGELKIVEDTWMVHNRKGQPGFVDTAAWVAGSEGYRNELGDSNTITEWDPRWCGQIVVKNVNGVFGFSGAYGHYGRGLVLYNGFDIDMAMTMGYDLLLARELAQGFDPDGLPCSTRIGNFVVATEPGFRYKALSPGRSMTYPLTLLSNQKYKGNVTLSASASPAVTGMQARFEPPTVAVSDLHQAALTLTWPSSLPAKHVAVEVKGTDTEGKTNTLCLQLGPPRGGELQVVSTLRPPSRTGKNLEIILDASGSMKTPLAGKRSRWDVALETLRLVLEKLPADFNVGLRIYGHREGSRSPNTCTDSELVAPIAPLDRDAIFDKAKSFQPKGETPLVYSALQAPEDLKALGGGTVVLITDGEESCRGDMAKAAAQLKASGLDVRLSIVGFALNSARAQKDLSAFALATGGRFYAAQSGAALADALLIAAIEKFPFTAYDASGKAVAQGEAGEGTYELAPGDYKVVVKAGGLDLVAPRVHIALGDVAKVTIALKNDQLVLQ